MEEFTSVARRLRGARRNEEYFQRVSRLHTLAATLAHIEADRMCMDSVEARACEQMLKAEGLWAKYRGVVDVSWFDVNNEDR